MLSPGSTTKTTLPPLPPSPPSGPPFGTYFSLLKLTCPFPPFPERMMIFAFLIGLPVLKLKSDYLAIATLGFAEIIRAIFQWQKLGPITNGSNLLKSFPRTSTFKLNIGATEISLSTFIPIA